MIITVIFFFLEKTTALYPKDFCKAIQKPPRPVLRETEQNKTSSSQPGVRGRQTFAYHDLNLNETRDFDLNETCDFDLNETRDFDLNETRDLDLNETRDLDLNETLDFDLNETRDLDLNIDFNEE